MSEQHDRRRDWLSSFNCSIIAMLGTIILTLPFFPLCRRLICYCHAERYELILYDFSVHFFRQQSALVWFPVWLYQMKSREVNVFSQFLLLFRLRYTSYVYMSESMIFIHFYTRNKRMISIRQHLCVLCAIKHHWHFVIVTSAKFFICENETKIKIGHKKSNWK